MSVVRIPITDRASWLATRGQDVTASVIGSLVGVHPYQTAYGLWALKTGRIVEDPDESPEMRRGRLLEDDALQILAEDYPTWTVIPANDAYYRDPDCRIGATPDAYAKVPGKKGRTIVQVKTTSDLAFRRTWCTEDGDVEVPLWIACQAITEAKLTGCAWAVVAVLVVGAGLTLHVIDVPVHEGVYARLCDEVRTFWSLIERGEEPPADYGRDAGVIASLFPEDHGTEIDLAGDNHFPVLCEERLSLKEQAKGISERLSAVEAEIKAKMGTHQRAIANGFRASWKSQDRAGFYVQPASYRVLRISRAK